MFASCEKYSYSEAQKSELHSSDLEQLTCIQFVDVRVSDSCLITELYNKVNQRDQFALIWISDSIFSLKSELDPLWILAFHCIHS